MKRVLSILFAVLIGLSFVSATDAGSPHGRRAGGGSAAQTIASVNLSNATYTSGVANALVGFVTVTMSPASPAFTGSLAITGGANTGGFVLASTCAPPPTCRLQANAGGTTGNGPYTDVIIVATQGALTASIHPTLTGSSSATLTETPAPSSPSIADSTPLSTIIQQFTNTWSNNEAFVGANTFASPNWDGNIYQVNGDFLIIAPNGDGVSGAGGTTEHVTTVAVQMDMSPDLTIVNAPSSTMLANTWGIWNFGPIQAGRTLGHGSFTGGYVIWLNGKQQGSGDTMEVAHGGVLYSFSGGAWFTWNGTAFVSSGAP